MSEDKKLGSKIKWQISRFAGQLTSGWDKVGRRFVGEMMYGIQAAKDVKVSNISRTLAESIALIKTENRLCRNLADKDLSERINRWIAREGGGRVDDETVLAVDVGDLRKNYAKKMEYLARIRDGSEKELAEGCWLCEVIAAHQYRDQVVPLYGNLYSQKAEDFEGENDELLRAIHTVTVATGKKGIIAIDRGGDRRKILIPLIDEELHFAVRQDGDRHIQLPRGGTHSVAKAARWCKASVEREVTVDREGYHKVYHLRLGSMPVRLPERPDMPLWLFVIRGFGEHPILLLTNIGPDPGRDHATWIADIYLTCWKCEEAYRFMKQTWRLEDLRVRSYIALRNLYALVHAVFYFVSVVIGARAKLNLIFKRVCEKAQRFYEVAAFFQYTIADGIHRLLFASRTGPHETHASLDPAQLRLTFAKPPS